jgi:thioredoxin-dependent peroxiredoxin
VLVSICFDNAANTGVLMTLRTFVCTLALLASSTAFAALKAGDTAPAFSATASLAGKPFTYSLKDSLAKGPVVVYFYPSAYTEGCNIQAHEFSSKAGQFAAAGATVIGVSLDSIERLNTFSADPDYCADKLAVASDGDGRIARSFGLRVSGAQRGATDTRGKEIDHGFTERTTFVVKRDGTVFAAVGGVSPEENVARALELVRKLAAAP